MKIKKSLIIQEAKEIKDYIEKNKRLPKVNTINNNIYSIFQTSYLLGKMIQNNFKADEYIVYTNVILYNTPKSYVDIINEKVLKDDYLKMINNFLNYCNINRRVPQYITTQKSKTKVSYELFVYCLSKIVVFFKENNYLPNYCTFNKSDLSNTKKVTISVQKEVKQSTSSNPNLYVSSPHYTNTGCNQLGQCTSYYCGPHSIHQAIRKFNITKYTEKQIATYCGTTTNGTSHNGLNTAIAKIAKETNTKLNVQWKNFSDMGKTDSERFKAIGKLLAKNNTAIIWHILYVSGGTSTTGTGYGHYEYLDKINTDTNYVRALNSLNVKKSDGSYTGILQDRKYNIQSYYARNTPGGQAALMIITEG